MNLVTSVLVLFITASLAQNVPQPPPSPLAEDQDLQGLLERARSAPEPQLKLLAQRVADLIELKMTGDPSDFKTGAMSVFRHCDSSRDLRMREAYLRLLQYPVTEYVLQTLDAADRMTVDGSPRDWPKDALVSHSAGTLPKAQRDQEAIKSFGAMRGSDALFLIFQTYDQPELKPSKLIYTIELSKLSGQFHATDYTIRIMGHKTRIFDHAGEEVARHEDQPIIMKSGTRAIELMIPVVRIEDDLRSVAVRGYAVEPKSKAVRGKSPWIACPTGAVFEPLQMLIHFATQQELPRGNPLPVAIALQEGLLISRSDRAFAPRIAADAYEWLQLALEIDGRIELTAAAQPSDAPFPAQMTWGCRYDGHQALRFEEDYASHVPSPQTLADMRGFIEVRGWHSPDTKTRDLTTKVQELIAARAEIHDFPDDKARAQADAYQDGNPRAYYVKGEERYLSYRDVSINQRWKFFERGFGLKGSPRQIAEFQRLLSIAAGLPTLWALQRDDAGERYFTLSFEGRRKRWIAVGARQPQAADKHKILFAFGRPWTRPERFDFREFPLDRMPEGKTLLLLDGGYEEFSNNRMNSVLQKGLSDQQLSRKLVPAIRLR